MRNKDFIFLCLIGAWLARGGMILVDIRHKQLYAVELPRSFATANFSPAVAARTVTWPGFEVGTRARHKSTAPDTQGSTLSMAAGNRWMPRKDDGGVHRINPTGIVTWMRHAH